jgi:Ca2+-binding RTX toxin-like protein
MAEVVRVRALLLAVAATVSTVVVATQGPASAATLNVPGTFPTIQAALDAATPGDTIVVQSGAYHENLNFHGKNVTLSSATGPASTSVAPPGGTGVVIGPGGTFRGFTVSGAFDYFGAGMAVSGSGTVIEGNVFANNTAASGGFGAAIGGNSASPLIRRNLFRNNSCDEQFLTAVVTFVNESSPVLANNIFEDNPCRAINMTLPEGNAPTVVNNTIVRNRVGIEVDARVDVSTHVYRNNILYGNAVGLQLIFGDPGNLPVFDHNLVAGNTTNYAGVPDQTGTAGNISADPLFVDYAAGDYHLRPGSPAIDAGSDAGAPNDDYDGRPRPVDGNNDTVPRTDIGAFEFQSNGTTNPPCPSELTPTIVGSPGPDFIMGTPGNDVIFGLGGDDTILGNGGDDVVCGGDGNDRIAGGDGDDQLYGGAGDDRLAGQSGTDRLFGGDGNDSLDGGPGADHLSADAGDDRLNGIDGSAGDLLDGGSHTGLDACVGDAGDTMGGCSP